MEKKTLVVNLLGAPSAGKSTMASYIFSQLKWMNYDVELVGEFAKELVWEQRHETFKDELYIFAKQNHRLFRLDGKVDAIITDRPIILSAFYNNKYGDGTNVFRDIVLATHEKYNNMNILLTRDKPYNPNGRNQTEEESNAFFSEIHCMLNNYDIDFSMYKGNKLSADIIIEKICKKLSTT